MHSMLGRFRVTRLTKNKPHVSIAQIHDGTDDVIQVRLETRKIFVEAGGEFIGTLDGLYTLGDPFDLIVNADRNGIRVTYVSVKTGFVKTVKFSKTGSGWYFKAGCYVQSNTTYDAASDYAEVQIAKDSLYVGHYTLAA
jgi:hypothetical protein